MTEGRGDHHNQHATLRQEHSTVYTTPRPDVARAWLGDDIHTSIMQISVGSPVGPEVFTLWVSDPAGNTISALSMSPGAVIQMAKALDDLRGDAETHLLVQAAVENGEHDLARRLQTGQVTA